MAMPKGFKSTNGYATTSELGGISYSEIALIMSKRGFKMNHSTVRNILLRSLMKIAKATCELYNVEFDDEKVKLIAKDPRFQEGIAVYLKEGSDGSA
mgnify:CR=1 FL=1